MERIGKSVGWIAAIGISLSYLGVLWKFATNSFFADDFWTEKYSSAVVHGHLTPTLLWEQWNESRMVVSHIFIAASTIFDHYNTRHLIFVSGFLMVGAYLLVLKLESKWSRRPVGLASALCIGIPWFSLAAIFTALWAFQLEWYLVVFFFVVMVWALDEDRLSPSTGMAIGIAAAVLTTLSSVQGILCWVVGAALVIWKSPISRQAWRRLSAWGIACAATLGIYFLGYSFSDQIALCPPGRSCTLGASLANPLGVVKFWLNLTGLGFSGGGTRGQLVGVLVTIGALALLIQTVRQRTTRPRSPLPAALCAFALLWDGAITVGRVNYGNHQYIADWYALPQSILYASLAIAALGELRNKRSESPHRRATMTVPAALLLLLVLVAPLVSVPHNLTVAQSLTESQDRVARFSVNIAEQPKRFRICDEAVIFQAGFGNRTSAIFYEAIIASLRRDHLVMFAPGSFETNRKKGLPTLPPCGYFPNASFK